MWGSNIDESRLRNQNNAPHNQWHTTGDAEAGADRQHHIHHPTEAVEGDSPTDITRETSGTWGERDVGGFDEDEARENFDALRKNLTDLNRQRSHESRLQRTTSATSRKSKALSRPATRQSEQPPAESEAGDLEAGPEAEEDEFELDQFMREGHFEKRTDGASAKKVGVIYKNLTVKGVGAAATFVRTLPDAIVGTFGPDLYHIICRFVPALARRTGETRDLVHDFTGCVRDGEMMLVLGRPGAGCSTFLKAIANNRESYAGVEGEVTYGGIPADKQKKMYRGEVNYNPEDDVHFASLNVWQTFTFALMNKTKKAGVKDIPIIANALLKMFGIAHTKYTLVGDEYTRGVSGGERKRVSIAETLASKSTVACWDNSTRGLDASTALDYARSLRIMTDISNRTTLVTLYQAGEGIYDLMDKVLVIDQGRMIFQGRKEKARQYFIDLGFQAPERQTTADFLTAVTDPVERKFRPGREASTPKGPTELETAFLQSPYYQEVLEDIKEYETYLQQSNYEDAKQFESAVAEGKSKYVRAQTPYTVSFPRQVMACVKREFWLIFGDTTTLYTKVFIIISNGLIVGSLFYGEPLNTEGAFTRGGALFFSILFLGWLQLTELMKAVSGRAVVARHKDYAFYRPSAVSIARVVADFPVIGIQTVLFGILMYFMCNLDIEAGKFFIYLLFVYVTTILLTALYRMFASLSPEIDTAVRFSGIALNLLVIYTGYVIPKTQLLTDYIWFGWIYWINPLGYSFEAVLTNEFSGRTMQCAPAQLVPQGPDVDPAYQGCALAGAEVNAQQVPGNWYLETQYNYSRSHLWRNFGVVIAFIVLYIIVTAIATELFSFTSAGGGALVFKKTKRAKKVAKQVDAPVDEEKAVGLGATSTGDSASSTKKERDFGDSSDADKEDEALQQITKSESIFTWRDVNYKVPYLGGERQLLNGVNGYAKPGVMVALMGASGAGKTTLLNTLSQRQTMGVVTGEMFVDGRALGPEFQRNTGFCLQGDLHDGTATIREALEFSAILRQPASTPRSEKLEYVDKIVDLLELNDLQDAIISSLGVEQRKRLTIGVELAAKPSLLLFLDEPTSGLDSQSAYSIVRFLKKLAHAGQAIVCTIHQPSSVLIQQFDMILALNPGGNCFYFGPVGENGKDVIDYFAQRGAQCPPEKNVAEFILETAAKPHRKADGTKTDWNAEWKNSEAAQNVIEEIEGLKLTRSKTVPEAVRKEQQKEFAAGMWLQTSELLKRTFKQHWRDPSYLYGKLFVSVIVGIFNGFTFWQLGNSTQDMQNRMFTSFLIITIPPTIVNAVVPKFFTNMALWQAREYPSRIYGWFAFTTAQVVAEIPSAIVGAVLYWLLWYWPTGLPSDSATSGYVFLMTVLFFLFQASWGQWICAFAPSFTVISNVLPFFFVMFSLFNGVVRPYSMLPVFWRYWMYYVNPSTWWIGGVLAATLHNIPVECTSSETAHFDAPPGQTCGSYAGAYAASAGGRLLNPGASQDCQYCQYSSGDQYLASLNINAGDKWRDFGIFLVFVCTNYMLVYFFIYTVRVKGWSFGFGYLFGGLGKVASFVKKPFIRLFGKKKAVE
ncbi:ATP-binding cassette transporter snq2 [Recurvomyces mirabilis]|uniref:ABC multidrug transporter atrF n=1 Tax=Recurvomyces mirabilis TaxID=574656 RepID=A0AAE0TQX6_9PEZI|nr:ATP-binding cassette transporter snq2 [Recurvomyces mirabilis]KAK5153091.1 ATP-binding cassette transporter snq2 [Recurvomyces mirabilis]